MSSPSPELNIPAAGTVNYPMRHSEVRLVDIEAVPLMTAEQTRADVGIHAPTVARVSAAGHIFSILDVRRGDEFATPLLVADTSYNRPNSTKGYKGIWPSTPLPIGRNHHDDRFDYLPGVSRDHFSVAYDGLALVVTNHTPTNATLLSGDIKSSSDTDMFKNVEAHFTQLACDDVQRRFDFGPQDHEAPYGYYKNHPIIGRRSTSVNNGAYFTTSPDSEAVVVDNKSRALQQLSNEMAAKFEAQYGAQPTLKVVSALEQINKFTRSVMPYSASKADMLSGPLYAGNNLIGLSEYVQAGGGVCRHQCLIAAFLAESLVEKGILLGQVGVERNHDIDAHGAHAWAVFKTLDGESIVIDPAQNFVGTKQQARKERRWKYDLPAEA